MVQGIAKKTCDALDMESSFHRAVVHVHDFESACLDYSLLLGRTPGWRGRFEGEGDEAGRLAVFALRRMSLELREIGPEKPEGLGGIRLAFSPLAQQVEAVRERGLAVAAPRSLRARSDVAGAPDLEWTEGVVDRGASRGLDVGLVGDLSGWPPSKPPPRASSAASESFPRVEDLDHVVVMSPEIEATRAFYGDGLGLRLALDRSFEDRGVRLLFFRIGGITVEVGGRLAAGPAPGSRDRFGGLAWQTPDLRALQERLRAADFDVSDVRDGHKPGTLVSTARNRVHGVPTLLIQPVSVSRASTVRPDTDPFPAG